MLSSVSDLPVATTLAEWPSVLSSALLTDFVSSLQSFNRPGHEGEHLGNFLHLSHASISQQPMRRQVLQQDLSKMS